MMPGIAFLRCPGDPGDVLAQLQFEHAILEGPTLAEFRSCGPGTIKGLPWDQCERGVLFGADHEVRFRRRRDGEFHLVLVSDGAEVPDTWKGWLEIHELRRPPSRVILWGEPDAQSQSWFEGRIHRPLPYTFSATGRSRLTVVVKHYLLPGEEAEIRRYVRVQMLEAPPEPSGGR